MLQGYDVVLVHEASEAIAAMKSATHPDLALLSYKLPGLTGTQVSSLLTIHFDSQIVPHISSCALLMLEQMFVVASGGQGNQAKPC